MSLRSVIRPKAVDWMVAEPYVENCEPKAVCGAKPVVILDIDCKTATADMVEHVDTDFAMTMEGCAQQSAAGAVPVYGFCSWFDVMFTGPAGLAGKTVRSPFSRCCEAPKEEAFHAVTSGCSAGAGDAEHGAGGGQGGAGRGRGDRAARRQPRHALEADDLVQLTGARAGAQILAPANVFLQSLAFSASGSGVAPADGVRCRRRWGTAWWATSRCTRTRRPTAPTTSTCPTACGRAAGPTRR